MDGLAAGDVDVESDGKSNRDGDDDTAGCKEVDIGSKI